MRKDIHDTNDMRKEIYDTENITRTKILRNTKF